MQIISVKELRENFEAVKEGLAEGKSYMLMYRSRLLGHIIPPGESFEKYSVDEQKKADRNLKKLRTLRSGFHLGKGVDAETMNKQYEQESYG